MELMATLLHRLRLTSLWFHRPKQFDEDLALAGCPHQPRQGQTPRHHSVRGSEVWVSVKVECDDVSFVYRLKGFLPHQPNRPRSGQANASKHLAFGLLEELDDQVLKNSVVPGRQPGFEGSQQTDSVNFSLLTSTYQGYGTFCSA